MYHLQPCKNLTSAARTQNPLSKYQCLKCWLLKFPLTTWNPVTADALGSNGDWGRTHLLKHFSQQTQANWTMSASGSIKK